MLALLGVLACSSRPAGPYSDPRVAILSERAGQGLYGCYSRPDPPVGALFAPARAEVTAAELALRGLLEEEGGCALRSREPMVRQYVGIETATQRVLYLNALPLESLELLESVSSSRWQREPLCFSGGGPQFWGALFDLETRRFTRLYWSGALGRGGSCDRASAPSEARTRIRVPAAC